MLRIRYLLLPLSLVLSTAAQVAVDLSKCSSDKGCLLNPETCSGLDDCTQIVTWRVSPVESSKVRFEMITNITYDYVAFALSAHPDTAMKNSSVLVCGYNKSDDTVSAFLTYNRDSPSKTTVVLPGDLARTGLDLIVAQRTDSVMQCIVDRTIAPTDDQLGLVFPLDQPWTPAFSAGPTNTNTGNPQRHLFRRRETNLVTLTDMPMTPSKIDISQCDKAKGCIRNPVDCPTPETCSQIVTWTLSPANSNYIRFEMMTVLNASNGAPYDYVAFALSANPDTAMKNSSVLVCGYNKSDDTVSAFLTYNRDAPGKTTVVLPDDLARTGLDLISYHRTDSIMQCIVDRAIAPTDDQLGLVFPLDQPWTPAFSAGPTNANTGNPQRHSFRKREENLVTLTDMPLSPPQNIDLSQCDKAKGCVRNPVNCSSSETCSQIVTWTASPANPNYVRFEMLTMLNASGILYDYVAFALSANPDTAMKNSSVLMCAYNKTDDSVSAFLTYNRDLPRSSTLLPGDLARTGIDLISYNRTDSILQCTVDRAITPTDDQWGLAFPLDQPWTPALAAGPTNANTGNPQKHSFRRIESSLVTLTHYPLSDSTTTTKEEIKTTTAQPTTTAAAPEIDLTTCGKAKGCIRNPTDCSSSKTCSQVITWTVSPTDSSYIRFEMMTPLSYGSEKIQYIAFGLAPDMNSFMTNNSVLVCAIDETGSKATAYLSHNADYGSTPLASDQFQVGVRLISWEVTSAHLLCIVERSILPTPGQAGKVFPLNNFWYLAWAVGPNEKGVLGYHGDNKQPLNVMINCTEPLSRTPEIDLTTCGKAKGCIRNPTDCSPSKSCSQIITWTVSPTDSSYIRFEMMTPLSYGSEKIQYIAFGLAPDMNSFMMNNSVLVCAIDETGTKATAYLSHNADYDSTPLASDQFQVGVRMISWEVTSDHLLCTVERSILPTPGQAGKVFPLNDFWYPAWAVGPNEKGVLGYHGDNKQPLNVMINCSEASSPPPPPTEGTTQSQEIRSTIAPQIDLTSCDEAKGCIRNPASCSSSSTCSQIITWTVSQSDPSYVRFEMMTPLSYSSNKIQYIAFGLTTDTKSFMANTSVLVCAIDESGTKATVYLAHNADFKSTPLPADQFQVGVRMIRWELTASHLLCVVERSISPTPEQVGKVFPLDEFWYPAWAVGANSPTRAGALGYHTNKQPYEFQVNCTENSSPPAPSGLDKDLYRRLHGLFMMVGWMICVGCSILTPRYLRAHWKYSKICGVELWFAIHRAFMLAGIAFVIVGFALILVINDYEIVNNFGSVYPEALHPYFGVVAVSILFANPIVALFRCKPGHSKRPIFNWVHGLLGGGGFLLAAANLVFGGIMMVSLSDSMAVYLIGSWAGLHVVVEVLYLLISCLCVTKPQKTTQLPLREMPSSGGSVGSVPSIVEIAPISQEKPLSYYLSTGLFIIYFIASVALTTTASVLLFVDV